MDERKKEGAALTATPPITVRKKSEHKGTNYSCDNNTNNPEKNLKTEEKFSDGFFSGNTSLFSEKMSENQKEKETAKNRIKRQVRTLFLQGGRYTASMLNELVGFNDARKVISVLRSEGMMITDMRLPDARKVYWLVSDESILTKGGVK